ncbi:unnamed protein product [Trichogramma brassicae]|uniref:Uncharacterized protein n=1 Tax=Trichogramma brassicae TaxID=86971 RepID=A0A6H5I9N7_9HYME|nr:unnamed protein product [Trichogramma brassicae]
MNYVSRFGAELKRVQSSAEYLKNARKFDQLKKESRLTGREMKDLYSMYKLYHLFYAERAMNLKLPEWADYYYPNGPLKDVALFIYKTYSYNDVLKKLKRRIEGNRERKRKSDPRVVSCSPRAAAEIQQISVKAQEPPPAMLKLHNIADKEDGWIQVVSSMVNVIPMFNPLGASVITLMLDDCPLPSKIYTTSRMPSWKTRATSKLQQHQARLSVYTHHEELSLGRAALVLLLFAKAHAAVVFSVYYYILN